MQRGPRIWSGLGRTHFLARFVLFHFSSFVYILTRLHLSQLRKCKQTKLSADSVARACQPQLSVKKD